VATAARGVVSRLAQLDREVMMIHANMRYVDVRHGTDRTVAAGEPTTAETGVRHTFRNEGDETALVVTSIHDPGRLRQVLPTLGGLAHDDSRDPNDRLQQAILAKRPERNTVFTEGEGTVPKLATDALAPLAHLAGYRGAYVEYRQPAFWKRHVERPGL